MSFLPRACRATTSLSAALELTRFSRSSRASFVCLRAKDIVTIAGESSKRIALPHERPMAGTGRRKGLYRRPVYWVACDRWKKVSLSAASSEIPRRPWRTASRFRFRQPAPGGLFVRGHRVPFRSVPRATSRTSSRGGVKKFRRSNGGAFRIPRGFTRVTSMSSPGLGARRLSSPRDQFSPPLTEKKPRKSKSRR